MPTKKPRYMVTLDKEVADNIKKLSKKTNRSASNVIAFLIDIGLQWEELVKEYDKKLTINKMG